MLETFGARLRRRREEQGIALVTIANQTKIKVSLLDALERDDVSHWPAGIFRRSFMRSYAQAIGLDADTLVREFLSVYPDPADAADTVADLAAATDAARAAGAPPTRLRSMLGSAFGSLSRRRVATETPAVPRPLARSSDFTETANSDFVQSQSGIPPAPPEAAAGDVVPLAPAVQVDPPLASVPNSKDPDLIAVAHVCTEFGRVTTADEVNVVLAKAARLLDASGLIVWVWDDASAELRPALVHGYSERQLAQLPGVARDADNATAAAFRSHQTCAISSTEHTRGALVVPLLTAAGCAGVLALEVQHGNEQATLVRVAATIFAALLAPLIGGCESEERLLRHANG
jgi:transcriptional regulator with XRE-family HTH domain